ncbi:hypothetical protein R4575_18025 [Acinetobacter baumannii]|nr:hypothetical protein [Acinetobacter baumannii]
MGKVYKLRDRQVELLIKKVKEIVINDDVVVKESDVIHALITSYIDNLTIKDINAFLANKEIEDQENRDLKTLKQAEKIKISKKIKPV